MRGISANPKNERRMIDSHFVAPPLSEIWVKNVRDDTPAPFEFSGNSLPATRYHELAANYRAVIKLASIRIGTR